MRFRITNARLVLGNDTVEGASVEVEDGRLGRVDPESSSVGPEVDLGGLILIPGLVDLHSDAIEREIEPRPKVLFPLDLATAHSDRINAAAGITTAYHGVSLDEAEFGRRSPEMAEEVVDAIRDHAPHALIDHRIHLRYEVTAAEGWPAVRAMVEDGRVDLVSIMDHTPGQGNMREIEVYNRYISKTFGRALSIEECRRFLDRKEGHRAGIPDRVRQLGRMARSRGIPLSSHDDDTPAKSIGWAELGATLCEFPLDLETARAARGAGLRTIFGAPNVVRGESHMGYLKAIDAIEAGVADALCSDYAPVMLLPAAFEAASRAALPLHEAIALVASRPAEMAGLADRGLIAAGKRADLVAVDVHRGRPRVHATWVAGRLVYRSGYPGATAPPIFSKT